MIRQSFLCLVLNEGLGFAASGYQMQLSETEKTSVNEFLKLFLDRLNQLASVESMLTLIHSDFYLLAIEKLFSGSEGFEAWYSSLRQNLTSAHPWITKRDIFKLCKGIYGTRTGLHPYILAP